MNVDTIGLILIPVSLFIVGGLVAAVRGAIRFAQYLVRTEESQADTAKTNQQISDRLGAFIEKADVLHADLDKRLTVVEFRVEQNGHKAARPTRLAADS